MPAVAVAVPAVLAAIVSCGLFALGAIGAHPLWRDHPITMAEAAVLDDPATVVQLIRDGEDPRARQSIRAGLLFERAAALTALEAAIAANRPRVVDVILAAEAVDPDTWQRTRCFAAGGDRDDVMRAFDRHRPLLENQPVVDCASLGRPW